MVVIPGVAEWRRIRWDLDNVPRPRSQSEGHFQSETETADSLLHSRLPSDRLDWSMYGETRCAEPGDPEYFYQDVLPLLIARALQHKGVAADSVTIAIASHNHFIRKVMQQSVADTWGIAEVQRLFLVVPFIILILNA